MNNHDRSHFKTEQDYNNKVTDYIIIAVVFTLALMADGIVELLAKLLSPLLFF